MGDSEHHDLGSTMQGVVSPESLPPEERASDKRTEAIEKLAAGITALSRETKLANRDSRRARYWALLGVAVNVLVAIVVLHVVKAVAGEVSEQLAAADEKAQIDQHTELGAQLILTTGTVLNDVIPLILDHHRQFQDGKDSIPLGARIITVADTYDAVLTDRPYRAGRMHFQAVEILEDGAGTQFDPKVVQAMKESEAEVVRIYQEMPVSPAR